MVLQLKGWKARFYVFEDSKLLYFKSQEEALERKVLGEVDLKALSRVHRVPPDQCEGKEFAFCVTTGLCRGSFATASL